MICRFAFSHNRRVVAYRFFCLCVLAILTLGGSTAKANTELPHHSNLEKFTQAVLASQKSFLPLTLKSSLHLTKRQAHLSSLFKESDFLKQRIGDKVIPLPHLQRGMNYLSRADIERLISDLGSDKDGEASADKISTKNLLAPFELKGESIAIYLAKKDDPSKQAKQPFKKDPLNFLWCDCQTFTPSKTLQLLDYENHLGKLKGLNANVATEKNVVQLDHLPLLRGKKVLLVRRTGSLMIRQPVIIRDISVNKKLTLRFPNRNNTLETFSFKDFSF